MSKYCKNCGYYAIYFLNMNGIYKTIPAPENYRNDKEEFTNKFNNIVHETFLCYKKVWIIEQLQGSSLKNELRLEIFQRKRNNCKFFAKYKKNIELPAFEETQKMLKQDKINILNFALAIIAIIISIMALFLKQN